MRTGPSTALFFAGLLAASSFVSAAPKGLSLPAIQKRRNPGCVPPKQKTVQLATTQTSPDSKNDKNRSKGAKPSITCSNCGSNAQKRGYSQPNYWLDQEGEFMTEITVGGQKMRIELDTGSADFFVMSTNQQKYPKYFMEMSSQHPTRYYNPKATGAAFKKIPGLFYYTGFADGTEVNCTTTGTETIQVGDLTVHNQLVSLADIVTGSWQDGGRDGVIGLKTVSSIRDKANENDEHVNANTKNFVQNAYDQGRIPNPTIAMYFKDQGGSYDIGMIDKNKYTGEMKWVNNPGGIYDGYWIVPFSSFSAGSKTVKVEPTDTKQNISLIDSGNTLIYVSQEMSDAFYSQIPGYVQGGWDGTFNSIPCDAKIPKVSLKFGDQVLNLPNTPEVMIRNRDDEENTCMPSLQPSNDEISMGSYFFRAYYTVFDYGTPKNGKSQMRIGFAKIK